MSAKRYFLVVWLAFSAPWIAGTGLGVYAESQVPANDGPAAVAEPCNDALASGSMNCPERTVASLADHVSASTGQIVQMDSSRSSDTVEPVHGLRLMDGIFVLGPPLLLLIAYCVALLTARLARGIRPSRLRNAE